MTALEKRISNKKFGAVKAALAHLDEWLTELEADKIDLQIIYNYMLEIEGMHIKYTEKK